MMVEKTPTAADLRPFAMLDMEAKSRGSVAPGEVVFVRRMLDCALHDRLHTCGQISDDQHIAACDLHALWTAAGLNPRVVARIDAVREPADEESIGSPDEDEGEAIERWRSLMRRWGWRAMHIEAMMLDQHPGVRWLATVQAMLDEHFVAMAEKRQKKPLTPPLASA